MNFRGFTIAIAALLVTTSGCAGDEPSADGGIFTESAGVESSGSATSMETGEEASASAEGGTMSGDSGDGDSGDDDSGDGDSGDGDTGDGDTGDGDTGDGDTGDGDTGDGDTGDGDTGDGDGDGDGDTGDGDTGDGDAGCVTDADCITSTVGPICSGNVCVACTPSNDICPAFEYCTTNNECVVGCQMDSDCIGSPDGPLCVSNSCVPCTPSNDICAQGEYCDANNECIPGCVDDGDCVGVIDGPICAGMTCVPCTPSNDLCLPGTYCDSSNSCVPGCVDNDDCLGVATGTICDAMNCVECTPSQDVCAQGEYCDTNNTCVPGCTDDGDCAASPDGPLCDTASNSCVPCTPSNDICPAGQYCDTNNACVVGCLDANDCVGVPAGSLCEGNECVPCTPTNDLCPSGEYCSTDNECVAGCTDDSDCGGTTTCDTATNTCVGCLADSECAPGTVCDTSSNTCIPGCNVNQPCAGSETCCNDTCIDTDTDVANCGGCGDVCTIPNADAACVAGSCEFVTCQGAFNDCNQDPSDGCETTQACLCIPDSPAPCYNGPPGTEGIGACTAGEKTCNANGLGYSGCVGQVLPSLEICGDDIDNDCNTLVDQSGDPDQDGFELCDGNDLLDCCEDIFCSSTPELINPAAYDIDGDGIDNDCDGSVDNAADACDAALTEQPGDLNDYARAMGLCNFTTVDSGVWGVTDVTITRANGNNSPENEQFSIQDGFGNNNTNREGDRLVILSSGVASDNFDDSTPNFSPAQNGTSHASLSGPPPDFDTIDTDPTCPDSNISTVFDSVLLTLTVRAPINAQSFSADLFFYSSEYPEWVCSPYNDYFLTLVDEVDEFGTPSLVNGNPADKNIAIYTDNNSDDFDIGVNILRLAPGLFTECENSLLGDIVYSPMMGGSWSCAGMGPDQYDGCTGTSLLTGTGFDLTTDTSFDCGYDGPHGGGTGWLNMTGNVTPGALNRIRFVIWDTGDGLLDSTVLLDNWSWSGSATTPGVTPG